MKMFLIQANLKKRREIIKKITFCPFNPSKPFIPSIPGRPGPPGTPATPFGPGKPLSPGSPRKLCPIGPVRPFSPFSPAKPGKPEGPPSPAIKFLFVYHQHKKIMLVFIKTSFTFVTSRSSFSWIPRSTFNSGFTFLTRHWNCFSWFTFFTYDQK